MGDEDERDRLARILAEALPPSMKPMVDRLRHLERAGGRIYEASRWAFWINGEEVCGYSSCIPLKDVIAEIRDDTKRPNPFAHSHEIAEMKEAEHGNS